MSYFQHSILNKYLQAIDEKVASYFCNTKRQDEWSSYFEENKEKINILQTEIDRTDR